MKNLKTLREKRDILMGELEVMVSNLEKEGEVRSLTAEERAGFDAKKVEIEEIDATIKSIEEVRAMNIGEEAVKELSVTRNEEEFEKRALDSFFRGRHLEAEERKLLGSGNSALMPVEISNSIMKKLEELCPVLDMAKRFSTKGTLRLIKESTYGDAGIAAEDAEFKGADVTFANVELRAYKVAAKTMATFEINNVQFCA